MVAVVGSPRSGGNTADLVAVAADELARRGLSCESIFLNEFSVRPCEGHEDCEDLAVCPLGDDACDLLERVYAADGLILASPVYYENVSAQMKAFIDRNCFNNTHEIWLKTRSVGLITVAESTGLDETIDALRRYVALSSKAALTPLAASGFAYRSGEALRNDALVRAVKDLAAAMAAELAERAG
ncbi:MAG TPA: flavodoxin family protein [Thermoleophilia bacterium]|nr:flavodoxin family protein [Thermoleophilia bacterium]